MPLPLVAILTIQAVLSARLLGSNTAFGDEALYLDAGRLEWAHWLHGQAIPPFQTWFSGSPAIYPPVGALADGLGGLTGARLLSLVFMLGATALLWGTASPAVRPARGDRGRGAVRGARPDPAPGRVRDL